METLTLERLPQAIQVIDNRLERIEGLLKNKPSNEPNRMLTVPEVAAYLHLSTPSIYRLTSHRGIPYKKVNGKNYFIKSEIDSWINDHSRKTIDEVKREVEEKITEV